MSFTQQTNKRYRFTLRTTEANSVPIEVHPLYNNLEIEYSRSSEGYYHRKDCKSEFSFIGSEFEFIMSKPLATKFGLVCTDKNTNTEVVSGYFKIPDGSVDASHGIFSVSLHVEDSYTLLEEHADDEYNLLDLTVGTHTISYYVYPVVQVIARSDDQVNNFMQYMHYGNPVAEIEYTCNLFTKMHFRYNFLLTATCWQDSDKLYWQNVSQDGSNIYVVASNTDGSKALVFRYFTAGTDTYYNFTLNINGSYVGQTPTELLWVTDPNTGEKLPNWQQSGNVSFTGYTFTYKLVDVYSRVLSDSPSAAHECDKQYDLYNENFKYVEQYPNNLELMASIRTSTTNKGYGKIPNTDLYYDTPDDNNTYYPLYKNGWWEGISFWLKDNYCTRSISDSRKVLTNSGDFMLFTDAVLAVANKIDPTITSIQSSFLNDRYNPVTGNEQGLIYITQKSNILNHSYDIAAWKAPVQFAKITEFLRNALNCYYDVIDNGATKTLRLEHIKFYLNGNSYSAISRQSIDLTQTLDANNRKPYAFKSNKWTYDADNIKTRYEFSWMDNQSAIFKGDAIVIPQSQTLSAKDSKEDRPISYFSTDIAFLYAVPSECSPDGFCAIRVGYNSMQLNSVVYSYKGKVVSVQNFELSMAFLQRQFLLHNIPSKYVLLDNNADTEDNYVKVPDGYVARLRNNEITFQLPILATAVPGMVVRTLVGDGSIEEVKINLTSDTATAKLNYSLE